MEKITNGSIILNKGKEVILNRAYKSSPDYNAPAQCKVGSDNATPNVGDTDLTRPVPISGTEVADDCETADWSDSADMTTALNGTYFKIGTYGLDLTKTGAASDTASTSKTTTSLDFTSKDFWMWLYIIDAAMLAKLAATDCVTVRFGSAAGDYYQYTRDAADLAVGWNYITFNTSTADSTTGAPAIAACDYSYIAIKATGAAIVWSVNDLVMDQWMLASSADYFKALDSGYPTFDTTNHEVTTQYTLTTTEAVGFSIDGFAPWNDDTSELMLAEDTHTDESKSISDEFVYIIVDRIE